MMSYMIVSELCITSADIQLSARTYHARQERHCPAGLRPTEGDLSVPADHITRAPNA